VAGEVRIVQLDRCAPPDSHGPARGRQLAACERLLDRLLALLTPEQRRRLAETGDRPRSPTRRHQPPPPTGLEQPVFPPAEPDTPAAPDAPSPTPEPPPQQPPAPSPPSVPPVPEPPQPSPLLPVPEPVCDLLRPLVEAC
jgi:hypothetical protein